MENKEKKVMSHESKFKEAEEFMIDDSVMRSDRHKVDYFKAYHKMKQAYLELKEEKEKEIEGLKLMVESCNVMIGEKNNTLSNIRGEIEKKIRKIECIEPNNDKHYNCCIAQIKVLKELLESLKAGGE